jgi:hypothetical protein
MRDDGVVAPDPVMLAYVRAPARPGMRVLAVDDLPIVDRPGPADDAGHRWPLALVTSQAADLVGGHLDGAVGDVVCARCATVLAQRVTWSGRPAVIGLVRGRRWSPSRSWGQPPTSAVVAARHRSQWFCLLDHPGTPLHLPLSCRDHGSMSVAAADVRAAPPDEPLAVPPPGEGDGDGTATGTDLSPPPGSG